jgi:small subunit ribosomal protein S17
MEEKKNVSNAATSPAESGEGAPVQTRNARKERVGLVVSSRMDKSIVVAIERRMKHPMYGKFVKKTNKLMAHDENNDAGEGDTVRIMESRPISKNKRWRLVEILERAK